MLDWGLDLSLFFYPGMNSSHLYFLFAAAGDDRPGQIVEAIHEMALANNIYEEYADCWLQRQMRRSKNQNIRRARFHLLLHLGALKFFLPYLRPGHYSLPVQDRLYFLFASDSVEAECVRYVLWADGKVQKEDIHTLDTMGFSLIKFVSTTCGRWHHSVAHSSKLQPLRQLRRDIIRWTALLHFYDKSPVLFCWNLCREQGTALHTVILSHVCYFFGCEDHVTFSQWRRIVERSLQYWLDDLREVGVDLNEYGKTELGILREIDRIKEIVYPIFGPNIDLEDDRHSPSGCLLAAFTYGPEPKDWKFSWDLGCEEMVGEFWKLIDHPPLMMPGAWCD